MLISGLCMKDFHRAAASGDCDGIAPSSSVSNSNAIADHRSPMKILHAQSANQHQQ
jgi:hypothetical protein